MVSDKKESFSDDDIVAHTDILSSPSKSRSISPDKHYLLNTHSSRHSSPSKKISLERVELPSTALPPRSLVSVLKSMSQETNNSTHALNSISKKHKRNTTTKKENNLEENTSNDEPKIIINSKTKRRPGRPRKAMKSAEWKIKPKEESKLKKIKSSKAIEKEPKESKIIKLELSTDNILPRRSHRRTAIRSARKLDLDSSSSNNSSSSESESLSSSFEEEFVPEIEVKEDSNKKNVIKPKKNDKKKPKINDKIDKPKLKRGRPKKNIDEDTTVVPMTPKKKPRLNENSVPKDFNFVSPLKKMILDNLQQYKNYSKTVSLKLNKNFVPAPLPQPNYKPRQLVTKANDFLDTFEGYLDQKKPSRIKGKSTNSLAMAPDVTREEFALISNLFNKMFLKDKREKLYELQFKMFSQYWFEITQGFTLLFYGVGSKREFLEKFAIEYLSPKLKQIQFFTRGNKILNNKNGEQTGIPCIVINGYNPTCSYRDVFKDIACILFPEELTRNETKYWGNHVTLQVSKMIEFYETQPSDIKLIIVVHNIDGPSIRKDPFQTMLSSLATIKQIAIVASADHIYTPILWDNKKAQNYNFIFHNVSNYEPYSIESSFHDVMKIGKSETSTGAEGARYVLESLTVNSKKLFKLLVETQISKLESETSTDKKRSAKRSSPNSGLEFQHLAQLCAQEFIASNDISLRSMLREFVEHNMVNISKNNAGIEYVWVPYKYSELQKLKTTILSNIN